jgi:hypothetical protein
MRVEVSHTTCSAASPEKQQSVARKERSIGPQVGNRVALTHDADDEARELTAQGELTQSLAEPGGRMRDF